MIMVCVCDFTMVVALDLEAGFPESGGLVFVTCCVFLDGACVGCHDLSAAGRQKLQERGSPQP